MASREREIRSAEDALARLMRDNPGADADVLAHDIVMALDARGWRYVIEQAPDWAHGGGEPSEKTRAALAAARETCAAVPVEQLGKAAAGA